LEHQFAVLTELRSRAGMLLAAASIAISFLGRESFGAANALAWLAVVCFALLSLCVLAILWPSADRNVDVDPQALLAAHLVTGTPEPPRRTLREKLAAVGWYRRYLREQRRAERQAAARTPD